MTTLGGTLAHFSNQLNDVFSHSAGSHYIVHNSVGWPYCQNFQHCEHRQHCNNFSNARNNDDVNDCFTNISATSQICHKYLRKKNWRFLAKTCGGKSSFLLAFGFIVCFLPVMMHSFHCFVCIKYLTVGNSAW